MSFSASFAVFAKEEKLDSKNSKIAHDSLK